MAPGWDVIGSGEPGLPGVAIGHNDRVAFGITIVGMDQQDLYVETLNPANPDQYRHDGSWRAMEIERQTIVVKGAQPRTVLAKVVFPSALPSIFTGMRLGVGVAWTAVIVAEMIAVKSGLGYVLWDAYYVGRMDICVATMFSVGLLRPGERWRIRRIHEPWAAAPRSAPDRLHRPGAWGSQRSSSACVTSPCSPRQPSGGCSSTWTTRRSSRVRRPRSNSRTP